MWEPADRSRLLGDGEFMRHCRCVVAAGGDGTIADVINEQPLGLPLAVLPIGNENLFARALGLTTGPEDFARAVAACRTRRIDLGRAGRRFFSLMVGVGFDADVVHRLTRWRTADPRLRRVRRLRYVAHLGSALRRYGYEPLELETGDLRVRGTHCLVFNLPSYALGLRVAPGATADDGLLDWVVFERPGGYDIVRYAAAVLRSAHLRRPDVHHGRAAELRIRSECPLPVQVDGEAWGETPVAVDVAPLALTVIVT
jgi:diacylglycerol kinase family enzyme